MPMPMLLKNLFSVCCGEGEEEERFGGVVVRGSYA